MDRRILDTHNPNVVNVNFLPIIPVYISEDYITEGTVDEDSLIDNLNIEDTRV